MSIREFVRRHVFHNLGLKITSLLLATGFWLAVSSEPPSETAVNVGIVFRNMPDDLEISSENIPSAQIRVRGPERAVRRLLPADVHVELDLTGMKPGQHTFDLTANQVSLPDKLQPAAIVPSQLHLVFDRRVTRVVPVRPRVIGNFPAGYSIASVEATPDQVEIVGPMKSVNAVDSATTDPIDVSGLLDRMTVSRHVYVSDPLIQVTEANPVRITITTGKAATSTGQTNSR
jgi:YbbR domain-containing protein